MARSRTHDGRVAILVQQLAARDAIGNDTVGLHRALSDLGFEVRVFASGRSSDGARGPTGTAARDGESDPSQLAAGSMIAARAFLAHGCPLVVYQLATRWDDGMALFNGCRGVRIVRDHNVTPARFLAPLSDELATTQRLATRDRERLAADPGVAVFLAASASNRDELIALGAPPDRADVVPPLHPFHELDRAIPDMEAVPSHTSSAAGERPPVALFVGRIAPHKGHLHALRVAASYRELFGEPLRLRFVGSTDRHTEAWRAALLREQERLGLGADAVEYLSGLDTGGLKAAYLTSDLLLCCSEHEGVCVPLIEASQLGLPVVARFLPAVAETLGPGALVCMDPTADLLATAVRRVLTEAPLRARLVAAQRAHVLDRFTPEAIARALTEALEPERLETRIAAARAHDRASAVGVDDGSGARRAGPAAGESGARDATPLTRGRGSGASIAILVPSMLPADATGRDALEMRAALAARGHDAQICAGVVSDRLDPTSVSVRDLAEARVLADDPCAVLIYHHATAWEAGHQVLSGARAAIVVRDHNVTPAALLAETSPVSAAASRRGQAQRAALARDPRVTLLLCDSHANASELLSLGAPAERIAVVPPLGRLDDLLQRAPDEAALWRWSRRPADVLFVGRLAPSKAQRRILAVAARYAHLFGEALRVRLVGPCDPAMRMYWHALERDRRRLGLGDAIDYVGVLTDAELKAAYLTSRAYLSCSEHEGYGVPLVEASALGVPIVAVHQPAVAETLGPDALVLESPDDDEIAAALHRVLHDADLRERLVEAQQRHHAAHHAPDVVRARLLAALEPLLARAAYAARAGASVDPPAEAGVDATAAEGWSTT